MSWRGSRFTVDVDEADSLTARFGVLHGKLEHAGGDLWLADYHMWGDPGALYLQARRRRRAAFARLGRPDFRPAVIYYGSINRSADGVGRAPAFVCLCRPFVLIEAFQFVQRLLLNAKHEN